MEIISMKKNCLGTMSFTLKIGKMRKAEEFSTYPLQSDKELGILHLQSSHRWVNLDAKTGKIMMSARREKYADSTWLISCLLKGTAERDQASEEQLATMLDAIRETASPMAGSRHVYCNNSAAALV